MAQIFCFAISAVALGLIVTAIARMLIANGDAIRAALGGEAPAAIRRAAPSRVRMVRLAPQRSFAAITSRRAAA